MRKQRAVGLQGVDYLPPLGILFLPIYNLAERIGPEQGWFTAVPVKTDALGFLRSKKHPDVFFQQFIVYEPLYPFRVQFLFFQIIAIRTI